jgi:hypothetical protein
MMSQAAGTLSSNSTTPPGAGTTHPAPIFRYRYRWNRQGRNGQVCAMLTPGNGQNICLIQFEDGHQMVTSRNALLRLPEFKCAARKGK